MNNKSEFPNLLNMDPSDMSDMELLLARTNLRYMAQSPEQRLSPDTYGWNID